MNRDVTPHSGAHSATIRGMAAATTALADHLVVRRGVLLGIALAVVAALHLALLPAASAYPPDPSSPSTAATRLAGLTVRAEAGQSSYDRDLFPHWSTVSSPCDTRETVLQRDGTGVQVDPSDCSADAGSWYSVYDGVWVEDSGSVDIDHIVPLAEAWRSGASGWTTDRRKSFANDLTNPQLIAVSASSNRSKGDQDPADWRPTNTSVHCVYVREWIDVKHAYDLAVDSAEKAALQDMLTTC